MTESDRIPPAKCIKERVKKELAEKLAEKLTERLL